MTNYRNKRNAASDLKQYNQDVNSKALEQGLPCCKTPEFSNLNKDGLHRKSILELASNLLYKRNGGKACNAVGLGSSVVPK